MAGTGVEFLERRLDFASGDIRFLEGCILGHGASKCPQAPPLQ
jgi:hypothetical protein